MIANFSLFTAFYLLTPLLPLYLHETFGATKDVIGEVLVINRFPLIMPRDELVARYNVLRECVLNETGGKVVQIEYLSQKNEVTVRNIHLYKLFMYNNAWFVFAFDEKSGEFRYFKINRIKTVTKTDRAFKKQLVYRESDYLDKFGMKQNGKWYNIKLQADTPSSFRNAFTAEIKRLNVSTRTQRFYLAKCRIKRMFSRLS